MTMFLFFLTTYYFYFYFYFTFIILFLILYITAERLKNWKEVINIYVAPFIIFDDFALLKQRTVV